MNKYKGLREHKQIIMVQREHIYIKYNVNMNKYIHVVLHEYEQM